MAADAPEERPSGEDTVRDLPREGGRVGEGGVTGGELDRPAPDEPGWTESPGLGAILVAMEHTTGPLPSKDWLDGVERHYPGVTKALVDDYLAERETLRDLLHRAAHFDETTFERYTDYQSSQLRAATVIVLLIAAGGIVLALDGKSLYGFALLVFEVAGLVLAFLYGRSRSGDRPPPDADA
jgi:hypothetical protein